MYMNQDANKVSSITYHTVKKLFLIQMVYVILNRNEWWRISVGKGCDCGEKQGSDYSGR